MANAFDSRRISNMFAPQTEDPLMGAYRKINFNSPAVQPMNRAGITQPETEKPNPLDQILQRMQGGQAVNAYREHIGKMPTQEQYAPSQMRSIGGALAAAAAAYKNPVAGAAVGEQITGAPYRNAVNSWQMKGAGLKEQADIEQQDVKGQLDYVRAVREQQKADAAERRDIRRLDIDEDKAATDKMYRQAQIEKFKTEGFREMTDPQGNMVLVHPDGRRMSVGPTMAGREQANRERATDISGYSAQTGRISANTGIGNLNQRGTEFNYKMGQDAIANAARDRGLDISQQSANQTGMNAGSAGYVGAGEQLDARGVAGRNVVAAHPEWANWFDETGLLKPNSAFWTDQTKDPNYAKAAQAVQDEIGKVMGVRRPGVGAPPGGMGRPGPVKFGDLPPGGTPPPPRGLKF